LALTVRLDRLASFLLAPTWSGCVVSAASCDLLAAAAWLPLGFTACTAAVPLDRDLLAAFTVPEDAHLFVKFGSDGRISGNGGCNAFFGPYTVSGNTIKIGQLLSTRKGCPGLMQTEVKFLSLLESADTYEIKDNKLILFSASGSQLAEFVLADAT
jgi:hypothetical protein